MSGRIVPPGDGGSPAGMPIHQRILADIRGKIVSGAWPPGHRIPFEHELTAEYGCSRMTVNKALSELARSGLIERRRKSGSYVRRPQSQAAILEIHDIRAEVEALGLTYRHEVIGRATRRAANDDRERLAVRPGGPLLDIACRHFAGEQPFCLEERLISLSTVPEAAAETFTGIAPGAWLIARVPWSAAEHVIGATAANAAAADLLDIEAGTACLTVERRTWKDGAPVTHVRLTYPAGSHRLVARFAPSA
ncbi:MAG: histidine utilization repressor [Rhizobiaceae bacterium]